MKTDTSALLARSAGLSSLAAHLSHVGERRRSARVVGGVGGAALAVALLVTQQYLSVYALNTHVEMGRDLAQMARDLGENFPFVREFDLWLLAMCGYGAAGLGLSAGALRGRAAGPFVFGVGACDRI